MTEVKHAFRFTSYFRPIVSKDFFLAMYPYGIRERKGMSQQNIEIKRVRIRSVVRMVFLFHVLVGLLLGFLLTIGWGLISVFGMYDLVPSFLGDVGIPDTSSVLILISVTALVLGALGALIWFLLALLYNVIAGIVRGVCFEVVTRESEKEGD